MGDKFDQWKTLYSSLTNTTGAAIAMNTAHRMGWEVTFPDDSTAGTVIIEHSTDPTYTGIWMQLASIAWSAELTKIGGSADGPFGHVRARLTLQAGTHVTPFIVKIQGTTVN